MSVEVITQLITTVGFPIAAVVVCGFFIYKITQTYREDLTKQLDIQQQKAEAREERLYEQLADFGDSLNSFNETLNRIDVRLAALEKVYGCLYDNEKNGKDS